MAERPDSESKAWSAFREASPDARTDALLDLFTNLDAVGSDDSLSAGFVAIDNLLEEQRFEQAAFIARSLGTDLGNQDRFDEAADLIDRVLSHSTWLSDFEVGMLYYVNGRNYIGQRQFAQAEHVLETSVHILEVESDRFAGFVYKELAEVRIEVGKEEEAIRALTQSVSHLEACGEVGSVGHAKRRLGEVLLDRQQFPLAEKYLRDAVSILNFTEWAEEKQNSELALGRLLIEVKCFDEASEILSRLVSLKSDPRSITIASKAAYYLGALKVAEGSGPLQKAEVDELVAVLYAAGLKDLAEALREQPECSPKTQTESKRNNPEREMTRP
jgi:tetratricopeptide (TPR) repeat protein